MYSFRSHTLGRSEVTPDTISCSSWNCYGSIVEEEFFFRGASFQLAHTFRAKRGRSPIGFEECLECVLSRAFQRQVENLPHGRNLRICAVQAHNCTKHQTLFPSPREGEGGCAATG